MTLHHKFCFIITAASALGLVGCSDDEVEVLDIPEGQTTVNVAIGEFFVRPSQASSASGNLRFMVNNEGTRTHEFLVVRSDLAPDALPMNPDGSFDEEGAGAEVIQEATDIGAGTTRELDLLLQDGAYVLLCNLVVPQPNGDIIEHYAHGMRAGFAVGTIPASAGTTPPPPTPTPPPAPPPAPPTPPPPPGY